METSIGELREDSPDERGLIMTTIVTLERGKTAEEKGSDRSSIGG